MNKKIFLMSLLFIWHVNFIYGQAVVPNPPVPTVFEFKLKFGTLGLEIGQFKDPQDIGIARNGNVYVADRENARIQKFTSDGTFITSWGSRGSGPGQFGSTTYPYGGPKCLCIATDGNGIIYVADPYNYRIQKFTRVG